MFSSFVQALTSRTVSPHTRCTPCPPDLPLSLNFRHRKYKDHLAIAMASVHDLPKHQTTAGKGTGFPEPFSEDRNTTLPHPDADTSKNATLEAEDVPPRRSRSRHLSFFGRHHSHHSRHKSNAEEDCVAPEHTATNGTEGEHHTTVAGKDVEDVINGSAVEKPLQNGAVNRDDQGYRDGERKKGLLHKANLHKD